MWWRKRKHRKVIKSIRYSLSCLGCNVLQLNDEELKEIIILGGKQLVKCGVIVKQLRQNFLEIHRVCGVSVEQAKQVFQIVSRLI